MSNRRIRAITALAFVLLVLSVFFMDQLIVGLLLLWLGLALLRASLGFANIEVFGQRPVDYIFSRTTRGHMPLLNTILMAPFLAGAYAWNAYKVKGETSCHEIIDGIWVGDRRAAKSGKFKMVLDMTSEYVKPSTTKGLYVCLPSMDGIEVPSEVLEEAASHIDANIANKPILIHCARGRWRSAQVMVHWLMTRKRMARDEAWDYVKSKRPCIKIPAQA